MSPLLTGFPFAAGGAAKATVTATTGSPTIDTTSRPGKTIYKYTGSGTITIGVAGSCEYLVIGGGCNNGAGGYIYNTSADLQAGTLTVTVGAGATGGGTSGGATGGNPSRIGDIVALAGGVVDFSSSSGTYSVGGGTGGGSNATSTTRAALLSNAQGYNGGQGTTGSMGPPAYGGGGGAGAVGGNAVGTATGGAGGAGSANSITGSSVTYCGGGGGYGSTTYGAGAASVANSGNGGTGATGNSGFVVVVIG